MQLHDLLLKSSVVLLFVPLQVLLHIVKLLFLVEEVVIERFARLVSRTEINVGLEVTGLPIQVVLDLRKTLRDHGLLLGGQLIEVVGNVLQLDLNALL